MFELSGSSEYHTGANSLSIDSQNQVLVIGNFSNGISFNGNNYSGRGSFLLKLTSDGVLLWHKIIRYGLGDFFQLGHVQTDNDRNIYISGTFPASVEIDNDQLVSEYPYNSYVVKFDPNGNVIWLKILPLVQEIFDMKVNRKGDIVLYSLHFGTVIIDTIQTEVGPNSFGVLLNSAGELQWIKPFGERLQYTTWPKACAIDEEGNTFFYGIFTGTLHVDQKQVNSMGGNYDFFFARVNKAGVCEWLVSAERKAPTEYETGNPPNGLIIERAAIALDEQENIYAGGTFWQGLKVGQHNLNGNGMFLLKIASDGTPLWIRSRIGSSSTNSVEDIVIRNGKIYIAGILPPNIFISAFNPVGDIVSEISSLPIPSNISTGLGIDSFDSIYFCGTKFENDKYTGFVFKYGSRLLPPLPESASNIIEPSAFCPPAATLLFKTNPIGGATAYEWQITFNTIITTLTSNVPEIEISTDALGITGNFSVRVRGVNEAGYGQYSPVHTINAENPLLTPELVATCTTAFLTGNYSHLQWYRNDQLIPEYENQTNIQPDAYGIYYVTISNSCGSVKSNEIEFQPLTLESIFIPNIITPGDNDINEYFTIDIKLESPKLVIYNRWGGVVYADDSYTNQWNGSGNPSGVYYYRLLSKCLTQPILGIITIAK